MVNIRGSKSLYSVVVAVNNDEILKDNFYLSSCIGGFPVQQQRGFSSAARALNIGMSAYDADYFILVHQDVYLPNIWLRGLQRIIDRLSVEDNTWAVIGIAGTDLNGSLVGRLWSQGINREINAGSCLTKVRSLDEVVLVLRKSSALKFDEKMTGFHLYGTDIVQQAIAQGHSCYCAHLPVIHNDKKKYTLDSSYHKAYRYMQKKWHHQLPISTTVMPITNSGLEYYVRNVKQLKRKLVDRVLGRKNSMNDDPKKKAIQLGYEE